MNATVEIEFAWPRPSKPPIFATATLRLEGQAMETFQWAIEHIESIAKPAERAEMEVWLREEKADAIARKFMERLS